jgi:hypothetical protein
MKFNFRTEMCGNFLKLGHCRYGLKCMFAHAKDELRTVGSPLTPEEAAVAEQVAAAIIGTQSRGDDAGAKRAERPMGEEDDEETERGGKRARGGVAAAVAGSWAGALEKFSTEELCSGELFVCGLDRRIRTSEDLRWVFE